MASLSSIYCSQGTHRSSANHYRLHVCVYVNKPHTCIYSTRSKMYEVVKETSMTLLLFYFHGRSEIIASGLKLAKRNVNKAEGQNSYPTDIRLPGCSQHTRIKKE